MKRCSRLGCPNFPAWFYGRAFSDLPEDRQWAAKVARRIHRLPLLTTIYGGAIRSTTRQARNRQARAAIAALIGDHHRKACA